MKVHRKSQFTSAFLSKFLTALFFGLYAETAKAYSYLASDEIYSSLQEQTCSSGLFCLPGILDLFLSVFLEKQP